MVAPTQSQIDAAVLKIKGMQYKLAWELVKEEKFQILSFGFYGYPRICLRGYFLLHS